MNYVDIDPCGGVLSIFDGGPSSSVTVKIGQAIPAGQALALMGSSGSGTDTNLHFMVLHNDRLVERFYRVAAYFASPLPTFQGDQTPYVEDFCVTNYIRLR